MLEIGSFTFNSGKKVDPDDQEEKIQSEMKWPKHNFQIKMQLLIRLKELSFQNAIVE